MGGSRRASDTKSSPPLPEPSSALPRRTNDSSRAITASVASAGHNTDIRTSSQRCLPKGGGTGRVAAERRPSKPTRFQTHLVPAQPERPLLSSQKALLPLGQPSIGSFARAPRSGSTMRWQRQLLQRPPSQGLGRHALQSKPARRRQPPSFSCRQAPAEGPTTLARLGLGTATAASSVGAGRFPPAGATAATDLSGEQVPCSKPRSARGWAGLPRVSVAGSLGPATCSWTRRPALLAKRKPSPAPALEPRTKRRCACRQVRGRGLNRHRFGAAGVTSASARNGRAAECPCGGRLGQVTAHCHRACGGGDNQHRVQDACGWLERGGGPGLRLASAGRGPRGAGRDHRAGDALHRALSSAHRPPPPPE